MARYKSGIATQARILESTRGLLGEVGFESTTVKAICERAHIRAGSFYNLFDSKDQVILTVVREAIQAVDPDPEGIGSDTVGQLAQTYIDFILNERQMGRVYLQLALTAGLTDETLRRRMLRHHQHRVNRFTDALLREHPALTADEARTRMQLLIAGLNGLAYHWVLDPEFDIRSKADILVRERVGIA